MNKNEITSDDLYILQMVKRLGQEIEAEEARYFRECEQWINEGFQLGLKCYANPSRPASLPETKAQIAMADKLLAVLDSEAWQRPIHPSPKPPRAMTEHELMILRAYGRDEPLIVAKLANGGAA